MVSSLWPADGDDPSSLPKPNVEVARSGTPTEDWTPAAIQGVLMNPIYAGVGPFPPMVSDAQWVAVHDAARCLVAEDEVESVIRAARDSGAAILAHRSPDTVKLVRGDEIESTPDRQSCWVAQTPQVFRVDLLREALDKAEAEGFVGSDDAQLVERLGVCVRVVPGSSRNLKITTPDDLRIAEALLR